MGAGFCSLYRKIHYIKVHYIEVLVYYYLFYSRTQNSTTTTGHRRLSGIPLVKNGEVTTSTSNSITVKLMSYNVSQAAAENLNGSAKRKTGGGGGVMEDFDALIKEHEQYGLKEFKVDRLEITSISGKD